jgi:hypothetical protein
MSANRLAGGEPVPIPMSFFFDFTAITKREEALSLDALAGRIAEYPSGRTGCKDGGY